ncbi:Uncharacterised protein [Legionella oakridgensis]|uniref:Uncharacterized protein n=2 Tax=Legionella longbeachae TaxID=450 RepID=D3HT41_LEGLN|nr:hypothetical protein LLO_1706 [Legionella longbeachae NSW150]VEE02574.1 Uncharacterised protein [Legionella oakridgensis]
MEVMSTTAKLQCSFTSDAIHNRNCYAYFLQLKPLLNNKTGALVPVFAKLQSLMRQEYNDNYPYGDLYSSCISSLEEFIDNNPIEKIKIFDDLVQAIYHNNNHILEKPSEWINDIGAKTRPQMPAVNKIKQKIKDTHNTINQRTPNNVGGLFSRLYSLFSKDFKPQYETNLPTIKNYSYKNVLDPVEHRFSTQAQRHNGKTRVSPLFKRWLQINAEKCSPTQQICHIYFNNLALDRSDLNIAGSKERELTLELHKLERNPGLKILVITLPAHEGLMDSNHYKINNDRLPILSVFDEFLDVAKGKHHKSGISDFRISNEARKQLFGTGKNEEMILKRLLKKSFKAQGLEKNHFISTAQKQAIWLHFIKYELTNYIINTIQPNSFNFSCKDAIDRGALSSSYYNLIRSFELNKPITREEFERSIDAAAASIKGRGMNFHRKIIWNALNVYVNANYAQLLANREKSWLIYWRDMNCPHSQAEELLKIRLDQTREQFKQLPEGEKNKDTKRLGLKLLSTTLELNEQKVSGKRLLLEAVSRTSELVHLSSKKSMTDYQNLANELKIKHSALYVLGGIMALLLGVIFYLPSLGYSQKIIDHGLATANTGFFAYNRSKLSDQILEFSLIEAHNPNVV